MNVLLDECVPLPLREILVGHHCATVKAEGWGGIKNGELLRLAEDRFDLFITADQNIRYQQNLSGRRITIIELSTNDLRRILAASSLLLSIINTVNLASFARWKYPGQSTTPSPTSKNLGTERKFKMRISSRFPTTLLRQEPRQPVQGLADLERVCELRLG